jgi:hypothetical protein
MASGFSSFLFHKDVKENVILKTILSVPKIVNAF